MKIVIDIPDEDYKDIVDGYICQELADEMLNRVKAGTPLPKGHGDLVDRDTIVVEEDVYFQNYIIHAPTVIPADQGMCYNCEYKTDICQEGLHCPKEDE